MQGAVGIAAGSILVGLVVLAIKYLAYAVTGSVALYSDALESLVNLATATAAFFAVRLSQQPPDDNHPYGHHKAEYFSAVLAGVLIIVAALLILAEAWEAAGAPRAIDTPARACCSAASPASSTPPGPGCSSPAAASCARPPSRPTAGTSSPTW